MNTKKEIRAKVRQLLKDYVSSASENSSFQTSTAAGRLVNLPEFLSSRYILAYIPSGGEADCISAVTKAMEKGKTVCVPKVTGSDTMEFFILNNSIPLKDQLAPGAFNILEPKESLAKLELSSKLNDDAFMIVPGVAFTKEGKRCGHGKAYYDRYIPRARSCFNSVYLCGFCHAFQIFDDIPTDQYDILMDRVIF